jgi:hypothetical protein
LTYLDTLAERIRAEVPAELLPRGDTETLFLIYAVLALAKREAVTAEDVHNAWVAWMTLEGKDHEAMREFADLPHATRREDEPFVTAIRRAITDS